MRELLERLEMTEKKKEKGIDPVKLEKRIAIAVKKTKVRQADIEKLTRKMRRSVF